MKKFLYLIGMIMAFGFVFTSCSSDDDNYVDYDTYPEVHEYRGVSFTYDGTSGYYFYDTFNLYTGESILIYMQSDLNSTGNRAWVLLPNDVYYYNGGMYNVFVNYDFTSTDFKLYVTPGATSIPPQMVNITFKVVVLPGQIMSKTTTPPVDYKDYDAVIKYYNIDESKAKVIQGNPGTRK